MPEKTTKERILEFLRQNPGRWSNKEIAEFLDVPIGTASSWTSKFYTESLAHGGAGVYAFPDGAVKGNRRPSAAYAWCHSRPNPRDLYTPIQTQGRRSVGISKRKRGNGAPGAPLTDEEMVLTRSKIAPTVWHSGDKTYCLEEVTVEVVVRPMEGA